MNGSTQFLGIVRDGKFQQLLPAPGARGPARFTCIPVQEARSPESGELDLGEYEGKAILIQGQDQGVWVYSATVVDQAGPIVAGAVTQYMDEVSGKRERLTLAYQEVCTSYHAIDNFRGTLLGLLPLASGAGILLLVNGAQAGTQGASLLALQYAVPIGVFGFVATLGLLFYEINGIRRCNQLITDGQGLEKDLGVKGQFRCYPKDVLGFIGPPLAAQVIYPAVLAAWAFVAAVSALGLAASGILAITILAAGLMVSRGLPFGKVELGQCGEDE